MLVKQDLMNKVRDQFDLNLYETKIWLALLAKGAASAGELASISGVPRSRAYDVLEGLEKKGFAIVKIGKPVKYLGVKPRAVVEKLKNNVRKNAEDKIFTLSNIKETDEFSQLEGLYTGGMTIIKREDISAALRGKANITNYLREALQNAKKEIVICINAQELMDKMKIFAQTFKELKKDGIKIKLGLSGDEQVIKKLEAMLELKIKRTDINAKFFIIDRKEILFYLSKDLENQDIAIWLNSEFFAQAFAAMFEGALNS